MVDVPTYLLALACILSVWSYYIARRAEARADQVIDIPDDTRKAVFDLGAALSAHMEKLESHCRRESSETAVRAKRAKSADNGHGQIEYGDYAALESAVFADRQGEQ